MYSAVFKSPSVIMISIDEGIGPTLGHFRDTAIRKDMPIADSSGESNPKNSELRTLRTLENRTPNFPNPSFRFQNRTRTHKTELQNLSSFFTPTFYSILGK